MAKQTGIGDRFYVSGYNMSGDTGSIGNLKGGPAPAEVTGIDVGGFERIAGMFDGSVEWSSWFNPAVDKAHDVLSLLPRTSQGYLYCRGSAIGAPSAGLVGKMPDYAGSRGDDGGFTFAVSAQAAEGYGVEWGQLHTAATRSDSTGTSGAGVDGTAATAFGLTAYLQVLGVTGTSVTVKLQSSSDNGAGDAWADVTAGAFTAATGRGWQRIQTARNLAIERYLRVVSSGTFSAAEFVVMVSRRAETTVF
jgi:hypothetical protein